MRHVVLGAGKFSHAHLRVLAEFGISDIAICKKSLWTDDQRNLFLQRHPIQSLSFYNNANVELFSNSIAHIVTPSDQHLKNMLDMHTHAAAIFVEKPAVLLINDTMCEQANILRTHCKIPIYHNDWLAGLNNYRSLKTRPARINFSYDVANTDPMLDLITEIASHSCNLLSIWVSPREQMTVMSTMQSADSLHMYLQFNGDLKIVISVSQGKVTRSAWQCLIDNEKFSNISLGSQLLAATFDRVINNKPSLTDWYDASWLINKLRMHSDQLGFETLLNQWYGK